MYSQLPLISAFKEGRVLDYTLAPTHIETVTSNVFLFPDRVYKLYKNDNDFFNAHYTNLQDREVRLQFVEADFLWNQTLSPELYIELLPVRFDEKSVVVVSLAEADEYLQVSRRMPSGTSFFDVMQKNQLSLQEYIACGEVFARREQELVRKAATPEGSLFANVTGRLNDIRPWLGGVMCITEEAKEHYLTELQNGFEQAYRTGVSPVVCFDSHTLNAFFVQKELYLFDTFSPKAVWNIGQPHLNVYRFATDIRALVNEEAYESFLEGYFSHSLQPRPDNETERTLVLYASLIMMPYLFMIGQNDEEKMIAAQRYEVFLRSYIFGKK